MPCTPNGSSPPRGSPSFRPPADVPGYACALRPDQRRLVRFGPRIVGNGRVQRDPAGVVVLADVVGDGEVAVWRWVLYLGPTAGHDAPATELVLVLLFAAVAAGDAVA